MDAAARAELDALRRRAFGPDPDIHEDPEALARLIELEEQAQPGTSGSPANETPPTTAPALPAERSAEPATGVAIGNDHGPATARRARVRRASIIAGAAAAAAIALAIVVGQPRADPPPASSPTSTAQAEYVFTTDPNSRRLMSIRLDAGFGGYIQLPSDTPAPPFPSTTALSWTTFLGDYYGWDLWVAGGSGEEGDEHCILIQRDDVTRARCMDDEGQRLGALRVSLVASEIPVEELPQPMTPDESIRFWWLDSGAVDLVLDTFDTD